MVYKLLIYNKETVCGYAKDKIICTWALPK